MTIVKFKNFDRSEFVLSAVHSKLETLIEKFPDLSRSQLQVILTMDNSPLQPGADQFRVRILISGGRYAGITIEKSHPNLFVALADLADHLLEKLNRCGDKTRVRARSKARMLKQRRYQIDKRVNSQTTDQENKDDWPVA